MVITSRTNIWSMVIVENSNCPMSLTTRLARSVEWCLEKNPSGCPSRWSKIWRRMFIVTRPAMTLLVTE